VEPVFHGASDWYVDGLISMAFPEEFKRFASEALSLAIERMNETSLPPQTVAEVLAYGALLAHGERLKLRVRDKPTYVISVAEEFRKAFLGRNSEEPTVRGLRGLINDLLKPLGGAHVTLYRRHRIDVWNLAMDKPLRVPDEQ
jgi:hypothetical protein